MESLRPHYGMVYYDPQAMHTAKDHHDATIQAHNDWCLANADALRLAFHPARLC